jgi:hypothetical protein
MVGSPMLITILIITVLVICLVVQLRRRSGVTGPAWTRSPVPGDPGTARRLPACTPRSQCPRLRPAGLAASSAGLLPCYYQPGGTLTVLTRS